MDTLETIKTRRSIRAYISQRVDRVLTKQILEAGSYAPSGLNNQPWRFIIIENKDLIQEVSQQTKYSNIIKGAPLLICIYLDKSKSYNYVKDVQAVGACIENMLLASHAKGLGSCWLGEILNHAPTVNKILEVPETYELMAVITIGYPAEKATAKRENLDNLIYKWIA